MAWNPPSGFTTDEVVTETKMDQLLESLNYLKGATGEISFDGHVKLNSNTNELRFGTSSDVNLFRGNSAQLRTNDSFQADAGLNIGTPTISNGFFNIYNPNAPVVGATIWRGTGITAISQTIISDGTGDVTVALRCFCLARSSAGDIIEGVNNTAIPGGTITLFNGGGGANVLTVAVAANGSVTIQRTAGALTYDAALFLLWW